MAAVPPPYIVLCLPVLVPDSLLGVLEGWPQARREGRSLLHDLLGLLLHIQSNHVDRRSCYLSEFQGHWQWSRPLGLVVQAEPSRAIVPQRYRLRAALPSAGESNSSFQRVFYWLTGSTPRTGAWFAPSSRSWSKSWSFSSTRLSSTGSTPSDGSQSQWTAVTRPGRIYTWPSSACNPPPIPPASPTCPSHPSCPSNRPRIPTRPPRTARCTRRSSHLPGRRRSPNLPSSCSRLPSVSSRRLRRPNRENSPPRLLPRISMST